jgi:hypothetical protein
MTEQPNNTDPWFFKNSVGRLAEHYFTINKFKNLHNVSYQDIQSISLSKKRHVLSWVIWISLMMVCLIIYAYIYRKNIMVDVFMFFLLVAVTCVFHFFPVFQYKMMVVKTDMTMQKLKIPNAQYFQYIQLIKLIQAVVKSESKLASGVILKVD